MDRLTAERIRYLMDGQDRDGVTRTVRQVAALLDRSETYLKTILRGPAVPLAVIRVDPRDVIPELKRTLSDEDVEAWNARPVCLCGCGEPTLQEHTVSARVPKGAYRLFRAHHEVRMPWRQAALRDSAQRLRSIRARAHRVRANGVDTAFVRALLLEYRQKGRGTFAQIAYDADISPRYLSDIFYGRHARINRRTAARLLAAMGEAMHPEVKAEYEQWRYERWLRTASLLNG